MSVGEEGEGGFPRLLDLDPNASGLRPRQIETSFVPKAATPVKPCRERKHGLVLVQSWACRQVSTSQSP